MDDDGLPDDGESDNVDYEDNIRAYNRREVWLLWTMITDGSLINGYLGL